MPEYVKYTPILAAAAEYSSEENAAFTGPFSELLNLLQAATSLDTTVESAVPESTSDQSGFKWSSSRTSDSTQNYSYPTSSYTTSLTAPSSGALAAVQWALSKVGSPYVWGAKGDNNSFDCSGLVYAAYKANGIKVPGSTESWLSSNKQKVDKYSGQPGDVIITQSKNSPSGRHARLITKNLGNGKYECVEAKGKKSGVVTSTYTVDNDLKNIYRAKYGLKLIKKSKNELFK